MARRVSTKFFYSVFPINYSIFLIIILKKRGFLNCFVEYRIEYLVLMGRNDRALDSCFRRNDRKGSGNDRKEEWG
jgi:hypothetical protein